MNRFKKLLQGIGLCSNRYPDDPEWEALADRVRAEASLDTSRATETAGDTGVTSNDDSLCVCCRRRERDGDDPLCEGCQRIYRWRPSRLIANRCGCGHEPRGDRVLVFEDRSGTRTFCGTDCAGQHYRELFGFLMRHTQ